MELGLELQDENLDLIPSSQQAIVQTPPPPVSEPSLSEEGEIVPLNDDLVMDVYNTSFNELKNNIAQA